MRRLVPLGLLLGVAACAPPPDLAGSRWEWRFAPGLAYTLDLRADSTASSYSPELNETTEGTYAVRGDTLYVYEPRSAFPREDGRYEGPWVYTYLVHGGTLRLVRARDGERPPVTVFEEPMVYTRTH